MAGELFDLLMAQVEAPLTLLDVGGHGGALENWKRFGDKARVYCFEARSDEADQLSASNVDQNIEYVPIGVSDARGELEITVAAAAGCSSAYPPLRRLYEQHSGCAIMRPVAKVRCATTTIDDFVAERGIPAVHGLKLDTQGFELRILHGARKALENCQFVLVETEFNPMYDGQPLFGDVDRFLREQGFVLWRLGNLAHYATTPVGGEQHRMMIGSDPGVQHLVEVTSGQLFWADAFYVRRDATAISDASLPRADAIAGALLASQWNFNDLAMGMIGKAGDDALLAEVREALGCTFVETAPDTFLARDLSSDQLVFDQERWITDFSRTDAYVVYGPYVRLPHGYHEVTFHLEAQGLDEQPLAAPIGLEVSANVVTLASVELIGTDGRDMLRRGQVSLRFFNNLPQATFEFRLATTGKPFEGTLALSRVSLKRLPKDQAG